MAKIFCSNGKIKGINASELKDREKIRDLVGGDPELIHLLDGRILIHSPTSGKFGINDKASELARDLAPQVGSSFIRGDVILVELIEKKSIGIDQDDFKLKKFKGMQEFGLEGKRKLT